MNYQKGFTLFELILTMVLSTILAGVVVTLIAVPIRSYFWLSEQSNLVAIGEQAMETMTGTLQQSVGNSVIIENTPTQQSITFQKVLAKGIVTAPINDAAQNFLPMPYLVTGPTIRYECSPTTKTIQRFQLTLPQSTAIVANHIQGCNFSKWEKGISIALTLGMQNKKQFTMEKWIVINE